VVEIHSLNPMVDFGLLCLQAKFFLPIHRWLHIHTCGEEEFKERIWEDFRGELMRVLAKKIYQKQIKKVTNMLPPLSTSFLFFFSTPTRNYSYSPSSSLPKINLP